MYMVGVELAACGINDINLTASFIQGERFVAINRIVVKLDAVEVDFDGTSIRSKLQAIVKYV